MLIVVYPTKVLIFQLITTIKGKSIDYANCCLPHKGTNFLANHNRASYAIEKYLIVVYPTKVLIFQLITTIFRRLLLLINCCLPHKGTNFLANHNCFLLVLITLFIVVYPTKVLIFQLITTQSWYGYYVSALLFTPQRY